MTLTKKDKKDNLYIRVQGFSLFLKASLRNFTYLCEQENDIRHIVTYVLYMCLD